VSSKSRSDLTRSPSLQQKPIKHSQSRPRAQPTKNGRIRKLLRHVSQLDHLAAAGALFRRDVRPRQLSPQFFQVRPLTQYALGDVWVGVVAGGAFKRRHRLVRLPAVLPIRVEILRRLAALGAGGGVDGAVEELPAPDSCLGGVEVGAVRRRRVGVIGRGRGGVLVRLAEHRQRRLQDEEEAHQVGDPDDDEARAEGAQDHGGGDGEEGGVLRVEVSELGGFVDSYELHPVGEILQKNKQRTCNVFGRGSRCAAHQRTQRDRRGNGLMFWACQWLAPPITVG
jgi:hypothetical protein